jgi:CRP-like cAMP-binding protein
MKSPRTSILSDADGLRARVAAGPVNVTTLQSAPATAQDVGLMARKLTARAMAVLAEVMDDATAPASSRVAAALAVLDRGHGRPTQSVETRSIDLTQLHLRALEEHLANRKAEAITLDVTPVSASGEPVSSDGDVSGTGIGVNPWLSR